VKTLVITANSSESALAKFSCTACGNSVLGSKNEITTCPHCGEKFEGEGQRIKANVLAGVDQTEKAEITCTDCGAKLGISNANRTCSELSASLYCPICGGASLCESSECNSSECNSAEGEGSDPFTDAACADGSCDEVNGEDESDDDSVVDDDVIDNRATDTEDDVKSSLDDSDDLQWKSVNDAENGPDGTLVAFSAKTGNPMYVFKRSKCSADIQSIFGTNSMISGFKHIAKTEGVGSAVSKFGGSIFSNKVLTPAYIESLAQARINNSVLPRLIECMALATEGGIKGIYPDINKELRDSMMNELIGSGIPRERVEACVSSILGNNATTLYASILAKAVALLKKPQPVFEETKAMICAANTGSFTAEDAEHHKVRAALNASSMRLLDPSVAEITSSVKDDSVTELKSRLNLRRR
jgi:predicted RNA-binding Zn-ribbon protein involved in translation (DUF1610 family)